MLYTSQNHLLLCYFLCVWFYLHSIKHMYLYATHTTHWHTQTSVMVHAVKMKASLMIQSNSQDEDVRVVIYRVLYVCMCAEAFYHWTKSDHYIASEQYLHTYIHTHTPLFFIVDSNRMTQNKKQKACNKGSQLDSNRGHLITWSAFLTPKGRAILEKN